jgi:hypothetical protein
MIHAYSVIENLKNALSCIKTKDVKLNKCLKSLKNLIDEKIDLNNDIVITAAFFHPYLKKKTIQEHGVIVEDIILKQLKDTKMDDYYEEFLKKNDDSENDASSDSESENEGFGANKRLKFDDIIDLPSTSSTNETVESEFIRYKDAKLSGDDKSILFGQVITF